jgi:Fe2+ transport system protein B
MRGGDAVCQTDRDRSLALLVSSYMMCDARRCVGDV